MTIFHWTDHLAPAVPRVAMQRGECTRGHCRQFSISISNGEVGLTVRFESETEFRQFLERGDAAAADRCQLPHQEERENERPSTDGHDADEGVRVFGNESSSSMVKTWRASESD